MQITNTTSLQDSGWQAFQAAKNLFNALHNFDLSVVEWAAATAGLQIPDNLITIIGIALAFLLVFVFVRFALHSLKWAAIAAIVVVAVLFLLPILP